MTIFQLLMLGASAYFAFKIYEHIQTLQDPESVSKEKKPVVRQDVVDSFVEDGDKARESGDFNKALAIYTEAKYAQPDNAEILFKIAYTMSQLERYDEAIEYFEESLEHDNQNPFAYLELSKIYKKLGNEEKAKQHYERAIELDEDIKNI